MKIFLDSSAIIGFLKGDQGVVAAISGAEAIYSSALCAHEVLIGEKFNQLKGLKSYYVQASLLFAKIETMPVNYPTAMNSAEMAAKLMAVGRTVDSIDVIIAAQALEKGATVLTKDAKHFRALENEIGVGVKVI